MTTFDDVTPTTFWATAPGSGAGAVLTEKYWTIIRREKCDGCGERPATNRGIVRGAPGFACEVCAERARYPMSKEAATSSAVKDCAEFPLDNDVSFAKYGSGSRPEQAFTLTDAQVAEWRRSR